MKRCLDHDDDATAAVICEALDNAADLAHPASTTLESRISPTVRAKKPTLEVPDHRDELTLTVVKAFTSAFWRARPPPRQQLTQRLVSLPRSPAHLAFTQPLPLPRRASHASSGHVLRERIPQPKPTDPNLPFLPTARYVRDDIPPPEHASSIEPASSWSWRSTLVLLLSAIVMAMLGLGLLTRVL